MQKRRDQKGKKSDSGLLFALPCAHLLLSLLLLLMLIVFVCFVSFPSRH